MTFIPLKLRLTIAHHFSPLTFVTVYVRRETVMKSDFRFKVHSVSLTYFCVVGNLDAPAALISFSCHGASSVDYQILVSEPF